MKKLIKIIVLSIVACSFISCGSTKITNNSKEEIKSPEIEAEEDLVVEEVDEEEYRRSTNKLNNGETVSKDQFAKDKAQILRIIKEIQVIMEEEDYESWLPYISADSKAFYSSARKINNKGKIEVLNGLEDYFIELFIPSRAKASINEIRYLSSVSVKAGEFTKPKKSNERPKFTYIYNFVKENGKWYIELPTNIVVK